MVKGPLDEEVSRPLQRHTGAAMKPAALSFTRPVEMRNLHADHLPGLGVEQQNVLQAETAALRITGQQRRMDYKVAVLKIHGIQMTAIVRPPVLETVLQIGRGLRPNRQASGKNQGKNG